ncbi:hypothetical protein ACPXCX_57430, partial [Streptomyces sp. DT225]
ALDASTEDALPESLLRTDAILTHPVFHQHRSETAMLRYLRKLADHGLIEEADREGRDGRERWWQPASEGLTFHDEDFSDAPE